MKTVIITLFLLLFIFTNSFSQILSSNNIETNKNNIPQDTLFVFSKITPVKSAIGTSYKLKGKVIGLGELKYALWINEEAEKLYKKGKLDRILSYTLGIGGVLGTAYMIDAVTYDYGINMITPAIITGAMYIGGIVLWKSSTRKLNNAVDVYNNGIPYIKNNKTLNMGATLDGVGLTFTF